MSDQHEHEYDGITELDNQLPRWWLLLFYFTIAFGVVYFTHYHITGKGKLPIERYEESVAAAAEAAKEAAAEEPGDTSTGGTTEAATPAATVFTEPGTDEALLAAGKKIFDTLCFTCHAADGGGLVGPNMTDDYYIHGSTYADSIHVITEGVPAKGMIPWKSQLKPEQIHEVASYIWTLRGTTPKTPKAPEGKKAE